MIFKNNNKNLCRPLDYINFSKMQPLSITGLQNASNEKKFTMQFWIYAYPYRDNIFQGVTFNWSNHNKIKVYLASGKYNFECSNFGNYAFTECYKLTEVHLPIGFTELGESSFYDCIHLEEIKIPSSLKIIGNHAFDSCRRLYTVYTSDDEKAENHLILPSSLERINVGAFRFTAFKEIQVPKSVTIINTYAFQGTTNLETIVLPFIGKTRGNQNTDEALFGYIFGKYGMNKKLRRCSSLIPGPGAYFNEKNHNIGFNYNSKLINSASVIIGKEKRFLLKDKDKTPGPGSYNIPDLINKSGMINFNSKYVSIPARSFVGKKSDYKYKKVDSSPGPGQYNFFSIFEGYSKNVVKKKKNKKY
jgi:hypothetical protein